VVPESPASVSIRAVGRAPGQDEAAVRAEIRAIFGRDLSLGQLAALSGAFDRSFRVEIRRAGPNRLELSARGRVDGGSVLMERWITRTKAGPVIHNDLFTSGVKGSGVGTRAFGYQVEAAGAAGVARIETTAARAGDMNGYYTWARLGYDAPMSGAKAEAAGRAVGYPVASLADLMRTPRGRDWWKRNGTTRAMAFDPTPGSPARLRLEEYRRERANRSS
jgi:hypothetical protein